MAGNPLTLKENYWEQFSVQEEDLEYLYNHLLDIGQPQPLQYLVKILIEGRIKQELKNIEKRQKVAGTIYKPLESYEIGQNLIFPALGYLSGKVTNIRTGNNPDLTPFKVIEVSLETDERKEFAAELTDHKLNQVVITGGNDPLLDFDYVFQTYGQQLEKYLAAELSKNPELVKFADQWFPRSLLVDINIGYLNLAEAVLDMNGGGPLETAKIIEQIDLPMDDNPTLVEFSLNLGMEKDGRFDEVGSSGKVLWFLRRLEPPEVQNVPVYLEYEPINYDKSLAKEMLSSFEGIIADELEFTENGNPKSNTITISLIYPHWRAGTLPLSPMMQSFFPTAYESPRVQFTFVDGQTKQKFNGWVVRPYHYVSGLADWYRSLDLMPGSLIQITRSKPGEVVINVDRRRPSREWIRTALVGADGGVVFAMLKQMVTASYNERMVIAVPDAENLDKLWQQKQYRNRPLEKIIITMMRELSKLNPQGHVHVQELYAAVNILRRCPPGPIVSMLLSQPWSRHMGDLYFRLSENVVGGAE